MAGQSLKMAMMRLQSLLKNYSIKSDNIKKFTLNDHIDHNHLKVILFGNHFDKSFSKTTSNFDQAFLKAFITNS